ncbi:MAG: hypothetical protein P4L85_20350 [Paludisphaera borealis]|uniref:hypothetical protein n=1 Tax=Paludisphaera borealis TaxID=1387353 RepID=UPI002850936F|nr:hypothetical protein [Paludisphaera borealis]MDR3621715.1 hypothetical protein [Paludisphaera borealis]
MKRLILVVLLVLGLVAYVRLNARHAHIHDTYITFGSHGPGAVQWEYEAARQAKEDADDARREALEAIEDARREVDEATRDAARDANEALSDAAREIRESVEGIPVPIVPGTRVTTASPAPPAPPAAPRAPARHRSARPARRVAVASFTPPQPPKPDEIHKVVGRISVNEERAKTDARRQLQEDVATWLEPYVPASWRPSERQLEAMVMQTRLTPVEKSFEKPYSTLYVAELDADFSAARRDELVHSHQQIVVRARMFKLAGLLGFVLVCLAAVSGYIRTDEATKGYYTNRLRMLAAAGVGAAGVVIYQMIA